MKTIIFSCMLALATATVLAAPQTKVAQDKPWRIYTLGASMNTSDDLHSFENDYYYPDYSQPTLVTTIDYYNQSGKSVVWLSGLGGAGTGIITGKSTTTSFYPVDPYVSDDNWSENDVISLDSAGNGTEYPFTHNWGSDYKGTDDENDYDYSGGGTFYRNKTIFDYVDNEHCDVTDSAHPPFWEYASYASNLGPLLEQKTTTETYKRHAQAIWHIQTGGKSIPGQQSLWQFGGLASEILEKRATPPFTFTYPNPGPRPIPEDQIAIGSIGRLGTDGNLWVALPDDTDKDITPNVDGVDFYTFSVSGQKYPLTITANGNDLSVTSPEFCVGQNVRFASSWQLGMWGTPPPTTSDSYSWTFSGKYVNHSSQPSPSSSINYDISGELLNVAAPTNWWLSAGIKNAYLHRTMYFSNGQSATVSAEGQLNMASPTVVLPFGSTTMPIIVPLYTNQWLELGNASQYGGDDAGTAQFNALLTLPPGFVGSANWTQLIGRSVSYPFSGTAGVYTLDTSRFYNSQHAPINLTFPSNPNPHGTVSFYDSPGVEITSTIFWSITIQDSFKTYLIFKPGDPNNPNNIWVTLGIVTWGWGATEDNSILSAPSTVQPTYQSSDQFPSWDIISSGIEH